VRECVDRGDAHARKEAEAFVRCVSCSASARVQEELTKSIEQDAKGRYICKGSRRSDRTWQTLDGGRDLFGELASEGKNGYPLEDVVVEQFAFFMPIAPASLQAVYEGSKLKKRIAAKYPRGMPLRLLVDAPEDSDDDSPPACVLAHDREKDVCWVRVTNSGGSHATVEGTLEYLLTRIEQEHLVHKVNRHYAAFGIDCEVIGVRDGLVMFKNTPPAFWTPVEKAEEEEAEELSRSKRKGRRMHKRGKQRGRPPVEVEDEEGRDAEDKGDGVAESAGEEEFDADDGPAYEEVEEEEDGEGRKRKRQPQRASTRVTHSSKVGNNAKTHGSAGREKQVVSVGAREKPGNEPSVLAGKVGTRAAAPRAAAPVSLEAEVAVEVEEGKSNKCARKGGAEATPRRIDGATERHSR
jgi:hypothetical protein